MASTGEAAVGDRASASNRSPDRVRWLLPALVVALGVVPKLWFFDSAILGMDEAILLIYPEQILDGRVPNRDFFTVYGPGNYWVLAAVYALIGQSLVAERLVGLVYQVAIVTAVMGLARSHGSGAAISAGVLAALLLAGPNLVALSWTGGLALVLWSLVLLHRKGQHAALASGVLVGLATCWRVELGVFALAALPLLWRTPRAWRYLAGVGVGSVPTMLHLAVAGREMVSNVFLDRMGFNAQRHWSTLMPGEVVLAGLLAVAVIALIAVAVMRRDRDSLSTATLAVLLMPQAFQRVDYAHIVVMTGCVVLPLAVAPLATRVRELPTRMIAGALVLAAGTLTAQAVLMPSAGTATHHGRAVFVHGPEHMEAIVGAVTEHVVPGSKVFVGSSDMSVPTTTSIALYQLMPEYQNDFYFIELPVGVAERAGSPLVDDIESADALVLTDHDPGLWRIYPHFGTGVEDANAAVEAGFCPVERLSGATIYLAC